MTNLNAYYSQQAGTGIAFYPGVRYQRVHGFFGRFFKGSLLPLLQSLGHKLLSTGVDVADDVINNNMDPVASLKMRGRVAARDTANDLISKARTKLSDMKQSGNGVKRRKGIKGATKKRRVISKKAAAKQTSKDQPKSAKPKRKKKKKSKPISRKGKISSSVPKYLEL
jgi:hypothetical protein